MFEKKYIGKGTLTPIGSVKITVKLSELEAISHEYNGEKWVTFEVAEMKTPDQYGKTHTVYQSFKTDSKEPPKNKVPENQKNDLPF